MGEQSTALANAFTRVNEAVIEATEALTAEQWALRCAGEGWTAGVVLNHIAATYMTDAAVVAGIALGSVVKPMTIEQLNAIADQAASLAANVDQASVLDALRRNGAAAAEMLRRMDDDALDRTAIVFAGQQPVSARTVAERYLIRHPTGHLASVQRTIQASV